MAKNKISEYSSTAASNTDVANINIAEGCSPSNINNAIRAVMSHLKNFQDGSSADSLTIAGTLTSSSALAVTGTFAVDGSEGTSGQVLTSAGTGNTPTWVDPFPSGGIIMWSGTVATIPSGWYLCDGNNGTPDLTNKFIIGADADDAGAAKTTVTGSATQSGGSKDAIVVEHTHTMQDAGNHRHTYSINNQSGSLAGYQFANSSSSTQNTSYAGTHSHTINNAGSSGTDANLPPYFALAFIMKA